MSKMKGFSPSAALPAALSELARGAGRWWGRHALTQGVFYLRRRAARFSLDTRGQEHLACVAGQCYLLVSNHVPSRDFPLEPLLRNRLLRQYCRPADSFIFRRVLHDLTGARLITVAHCWHGVLSESRRKRWLQKHLWRPFLRSQFESLPDFVPVETQPGLYQRRFVRDVMAAKRANEPLLIFPGDICPAGDVPWMGPVRAGAAYLALKLDLPILPACIVGGESWRQGQEATVAFGNPFSADGMNHEQVTEEIVRRVTDLMVQVRACP